MKNVNTRHPDYDTYAAKWKRVRDALAGQDAVHAAGPAYLPRLKDQADDDYTAYVKRAGFYNASWRTVSGLLGMMFRKAPTMDMPAAMDTYAEDIDMAGTTLETFAKRLALEVLGAGRVGVMVDHPEVQGVQPLTVAVAQQQGLRPMLKTYRAESIINWKHGRVNNHWVLVQVVLEEVVDEPDGPFKVERVTQWRVLELDESGFYRQQVWRKAKGATDDFEQVGTDIYPMIGNRNLAFIPFYIVGTDGVESDLDEPPLIDLVDVNLSHYRTTADYEHGCHFTGLPTAYVAGHQKQDGESFYIGSTSAWVFADPLTKVGFLEFTGQGLGSLRENLDRKEQQMAVLGARMIAQEKKVAETATTAAIHRSGENGVLGSIAIAVGSSLEQALTVFAEWAGIGAEITYELNRDYNPALLDASTITALLKAVQLGQMSEQSLFDLMQRADLIDSEVSFDEEQERIGQVDIPAPVAANDPAGSVAA